VSGGRPWCITRHSLLTRKNASWQFTGCAGKRGGDNDIATSTCQPELREEDMSSMCRWYSTTELTGELLCFGVGPLLPSASCLYSTGRQCPWSAIHAGSVGGFPPRATTGCDLGQDWDRAMATAACRFAIAKARKEVARSFRASPNICSAWSSAGQSPLFAACWSEHVYRAANRWSRCTRIVLLYWFMIRSFRSFVLLRFRNPTFVRSFHSAYRPNGRPSVVLESIP